ncbi:MAG: hypothetical protein ACP5SB_01600 [Caldisericaceae bacterium]
MNQKSTGTEGIETELRRISRKVDLLGRFAENSGVTINDLINVRGFSLKETSSTRKFLQRIDTDLLFESLTSYYFRRFLGDALNLGTVDREKTSILISKWGRDCLDFIAKAIEIGIAKKMPYGLGMKLTVNDFGVMLEWFIAEFLRKSESFEAIFEVHLKNLKDGGDIDILARNKLDLIMIECKESPPNNVPVSELKSIMARVHKIDPDIFILAIDTTLSIQRNILDNINWISHSLPIRLREGVYIFNNNSFVVTAKRDLLKNISFAISLANKH